MSMFQCSPRESGKTVSESPGFFVCVCTKVQKTDHKVNGIRRGAESPIFLRRMAPIWGFGLDSLTVGETEAIRVEEETPGE